MKTKANDKWFWAWLVCMTMPVSRWGKSAGRGEIWKSLILIRAGTPREAIAKAFEKGAECSGDSRGSLRIWGQPGKSEFLGVAGMGLLHEGLGDGAEIFWELRVGRQDVARRMAKSREELRQSLEGDVGSGESLSRRGRKAAEEWVRDELSRLKDSRPRSVSEH